MSHQHHRHQRNKLKSLYVWHRYMGLSAALFVLWLSLSGVLLNHAAELKLASRHLSSSLLLDWYGVQVPSGGISFRAGDHWLSRLGERVYIDDRRLPGEYHSLLGAVELEDMLIAGVDGAILLLTMEGEIIERLSTAQGLPAGLLALGVDQAGLLWVKTRGGRYQADRNLLTWRDHTDATGVAWVQAQDSPETLQARLRTEYRHDVLSWQRLLQDAHSGRLLGPWGPWLMDAMALLFVLLALSGVTLWLRRRR